MDVDLSTGEKLVYGSSGDDIITGTGLDDELIGRLGDDELIGGLGNDILSGGDGNDIIHYDSLDSNVISGDDGLDTLLDMSPGATINLNGVINLQNFEKFDMRDADGTDSLTVDLAGLTNLIGDNGIEDILPDGRDKFIIDGDSGDQLFLDGNAIHSGIAAGSLIGGWTADPAGEINHFGTGTNYLKLTNGSLDLYVHEDVANVT